MKPQPSAMTGPPASRGRSTCTLRRTVDGSAERELPIPPLGGVSISKRARARDVGGALSWTAHSPRCCWTRVTAHCYGPALGRAWTLALRAHWVRVTIELALVRIRRPTPAQEHTESSRSGLSSNDIDEITAQCNDGPVRISRAVDAYGEAQDQWVSRARAPTPPLGVGGGRH